MAWAAFQAPRGELLDGATKAGVGSPLRSANNAHPQALCACGYPPTPPEPFGRVGVAVELGVASTSVKSQLQLSADAP